MVPTGFAEEVPICPIGLPALLTTRPLGPGHHRCAQRSHTGSVLGHYMLAPRGTAVLARDAETSYQQGGYREEFSKWHQKTYSRSRKSHMLPRQQS